jgi:hypothetical protein
MGALEEHLETISKEVDRASMITYIESWPRRNAEKKKEFNPGGLTLRLRDS